MTMNTRFQYKSPIQQIYEWRNAYVLEYGSMPTVIEMDARSWDAVVHQCIKGNPFMRTDPMATTEAPHICGMQVVIKEHDNDQG